MNIAISGATGFVGTHLSRHLKQQGHQIIALSRFDFQPEASDLLDNKLSSCACVINLAGASIAGRWTDDYKKEIYDSRIYTTRRLVDSISRIQTKPDLFISTSAVGYYPTTGKYNEENAINGHGFLAQVCHDWEQEASRVDAGVRLVITRFAPVLSSDGGLLPSLITPFKYGLGARISSGMQPFPWIYLPDLIRIYDFIFSHPDIRGVINCVSPGQVDNATFTQILAKALHRPAYFSIPRPILRLLLKDGETLLTEGQDVSPAVLLKSGFKFDYPEIGQALDDCIKQLQKRD